MAEAKREAGRNKQLSAVREVNDDIQRFVSTHGRELPEALLKLVSDLDWQLRP